MSAERPRLQQPHAIIKGRVLATIRPLPQMDIEKVRAVLSSMDISGRDLVKKDPLVYRLTDAIPLCAWETCGD